MFAPFQRYADLTARTVALTGLGIALIIAATHWAVRRNLLKPFAWWPVRLRRLIDPVLRPVERRVLAAGGNPQDAPLWLLGGVLVGGLLLMIVVRWLSGGVATLAAMRGAGPLAWLRLLVGVGTGLLMLAIMVRVVASWLGAGRYRRWMRPVYVVTDWLVEPIRRRLNPLWPLDLSPLVAYLALVVLRMFLLGVVLR